jgi:hypothetical protein
LDIIDENEALGCTDRVHFKASMFEKGHSVLPQSELGTGEWHQWDKQFCGITLSFGIG